MRFLSIFFVKKFRNTNKGGFEMENKYYTVSELAQVLHIGKNKAYDLVHTDGFPSIKLGSRIIVPADSLKEWVKKQCGEAGA